MVSMVYVIVWFHSIMYGLRIRFEYFTSFYYSARKEFLREILYKNIAIIAIQHSKMYFVDTFGDSSHIVEGNSLKSIWQISLYI